MTTFKYKIHGINGIFCMPIDKNDRVSRIISLIKKNFKLEEISLKAKIYGDELDGNLKLYDCVQPTDVVTFVSSSQIHQSEDLILYELPPPDHFYIYSTASVKSMTRGDKIKIDINSEYNSVSRTIFDFLKKKYPEVGTLQMHLFLPTGVPFLSGKISDFIQYFPQYKPNLYAIFTNKIVDAVLNKTYEEVCDISTNDRKLLLSPLSKSSVESLCQIASVLGYIQRDGENVFRMIYSIAKFCPFAPLICGLFRMANLNDVNGRAIIMVTAPLFVLFKEMDENVKDENIFANTAKFLTYFMNMKIDTEVPCSQFDSPYLNIGYETYFLKFIPNTEKMVISWDPDFRGIDWITFKLPELDDSDFEDAMEETQSLAIVPPLSLREMHRASLFAGSNGAWLFLVSSASKKREDRDKMDFINPERGVIETDEPEKLAKIVINNQNTRKITDTMDKKDVTQIVFIVVDESFSMSCPFDYGATRFDAARQFFVTFASRCYTFHTSTLYGLISFTHSVYVRNELNPLTLDFEKAIDSIRPNGATSMFSAMKVAAERMINLTKNREYPNATLRIILLTDGDDNRSSQSDINALPSLIYQYKIRVDSVIIGRELEHRLVALTRMSGGVILAPNTIKEGISYFDQEVFFNLDLRKFGPFQRKSPDEIRNAPHVNYESLDRAIPYKEEYLNPAITSLATPRYMVSQEEGKGPGHGKVRRIMNELKNILAEPNPNIRVFPQKDRIDFWRALIKGPEGSYYDGFWFSLTIEFPTGYPQNNPIIRFVKAPFHPNITNHGRICIDTLDIGYHSTYTINRILTSIIGLLLLPNYHDPVDVDHSEFYDAVSTQSKKSSVFPQSILDKINAKNQESGKRNADDWISHWNIEDKADADIKDLQKHIEVPEQFLCPFSKKIMKEPVKASTGYFYEKRVLENFIRKTPKPKCPITGNIFDKVNDMNLEIDMEQKQKIKDWIDVNNYQERAEDCE
ncbi:hypothetical protein TRFO_18140 [Tritrichomonas foetus]|uniref:Ubiquitin-conjugating enzyme family protein n=1 Tax=Tritrichomonas foetus TaxID=1144522 RepID=A0A1J4KR53_9EUKA|nr:hypothetical protein TRFO_18140 [Tritrichomonas foetus]|eukprot:OHT12150.1 hypothetical protein TRFO_18140 [Tritrichomonas foetus]